MNNFLVRFDADSREFIVTKRLSNKPNVSEILFRSKDGNQLSDWLMVTEYERNQEIYDNFG